MTFYENKVLHKYELFLITLFIGCKYYNYISQKKKCNKAYKVVTYMY